MYKIIIENNKIFVKTSSAKYEFETEAKAVNFIYSCKQAKKEYNRGNKTY